MRTIVIGDIHGCYKELKKMIKKLKAKGIYTEGVDKLVFLGDYIDRGKDSRRVIKYIRRLQSKNDKVIALKGNHEDMIVKHYKSCSSKYQAFGTATVDSYKGKKREFKKDLKWMENLPLYHEDKHFVYVHAGVNINRTMDKQDPYTLLWIRDSFIFNERKYRKKVIFGHTPVVTLTGKYNPVQTMGGNYLIDTACVYGGNLTALVIDDDMVSGFHQVKKGEDNND